jgi:hypothetical protein
VRVIHVPKPKYFRLASIEAAERRRHRRDWLAGALLGLAAAVTIAWAFFLAWLPVYVVRWLWLNAQ